MIRAPKILLIFALLATAAPLDLSAWKFRKRIPLTPGDAVAVVKLDRDVYIGSANEIADLRVVRDGQEVPFILNTSLDRPPAAVASEQLLNEAVVPGVGFEFTIHLQAPMEHHRIDLQTNEKNFRQRVRIETSHDGARWAVARNDGAIFNFSQDGNELSSTSVVYPPSTRPFLRVTIFGWTKTGLINAATVVGKRDEAPALEALATITAQIVEDPLTKSTVLTLDQGASGLPVSRILINTRSPQFQRAVTIETSGDGQDWSHLAQSVIARLPGPEFSEESLLIPAFGARRHLRLRIYNRDDQPLQIASVTLEGVLGSIKLLARDPGEYWLYYGNPKAATLPEYDLSAVLAHRSLPEASFTAGAAGNNPAYRAPEPPRKPWSEQHPAILYTVLGGAVVALGIATLRFAARLR